MSRWEADREELGAAWYAACDLYWHLAQGGELTPVSRGELPEESNYADCEFGYARFYGHDPSVVLAAAAGALHSRRVARKAEDMVQPKWRDHRRVTGLLTNHRVLCQVDGAWLGFWHESIEGVSGELERWWFALTYRDADPLMIFGPAAPFLAVGLFWQSYGELGLRIPLLDPIAVDAETRAHTPEAVRPPAYHPPPG